jgi:hypothetical protein
LNLSSAKIFVFNEIFITSDLYYFFPYLLEIHKGTIAFTETRGVAVLIVVVRGAKRKVSRARIRRCVCQGIVFLIGSLLHDLDPLEGRVVEYLSPISGTAIRVVERRIEGRVGNLGDGRNTPTTPCIAQRAVIGGGEIGLFGSIRQGHCFYFLYGIEKKKNL